MAPTPNASNEAAGKRATFRFSDLPAEPRVEVYEYLALPVARRLPLSAIDIYWNDYDTAILRACKFVAQEARPLFRHNYTLTFTYYANNAETSKGEMMISYSNCLMRIGYMLKVLCRGSSRGYIAREWDWVLRCPCQIRHCDLSALDPFFRKALKLIRKTRPIKYRLELIFEPRTSLSFEHDFEHLLRDVGFGFDDHKSRLNTSVSLTRNRSPYIHHQNFIAHADLTSINTQGLWSIEPLNQH